MWCGGFNNEFLLGSLGGGPGPGLEWACGGLVVGFGGLVVGFGGLSMGFRWALVGFWWAFGGLRWTSVSFGGLVVG